MNTWSARWPGLAGSIALALLGVAFQWGQAQLLPRPVVDALVVTLLLGVAVRAAGVMAPSRLAPGASFAAGRVLEVSVALLGLGVDVGALWSAGLALAMVIVVGVAVALGGGFLIGRAFGLSPKLAMLVAAGNAICGNSAIAAVATAIDADKDDIARAVALTAVFGVALVLGLPLSVTVFALGPRDYGVLAGMSVYAVPQVIAAAFPVSALSGEVATLVKLARVALLGPLVLLSAVLFRVHGARGADAQGARAKLPRFPRFVLVFFALMAVRATGLVPATLATLTKQVSHALAMVAMAGLGLGVDLSQVRRASGRVAVVVVLAMALMLGVSLLLIKLLL